MPGCGVRSPYPSPAPKPGQKGQDTAAPRLGPGMKRGPAVSCSRASPRPCPTPCLPPLPPHPSCSQEATVGGCCPSEPVCSAGFQKDTGPDSGLLSKLRDCERQVGSKVGISFSPGRTCCRNMGGGDRRVRRTWLADHVQGGRCWTDIGCRGAQGQCGMLGCGLRADTPGKGGVTPRT